MKTLGPVATLLVTIGLGTLAATACRAQALETESARFLHRGSYELGSAFEFQTSGEGIERAVPLAMEYGVTDRFSMLVEPVVYTAIRPKHGAGATGPGDLEVTAFYLMRPEAPRLPALALALEVKLPTAGDPLIGTGQTDWAAYAIASRRAGRLDAHANLGYNLNGQPPGVKLNNTISGALATEYHLSDRGELFVELLGTTASVGEGGGDNPANPNPVAPEVGGSELVGTAGVGWSPVPHSLLSLGVSYDNNHALLLRPGVTYRLR